MSIKSVLKSVIGSGGSVNEKDSVNALLRLISKGNEGALDNFMEMYSKKLYVYAVSIVKYSEIAEEVVSDVFLEVWRNRSGILQIERINSWLYTVTYNKAISRLRSEKRHIDNLPIDGFEPFMFPSTSTPVDSLISQEEVTALQVAIDDLPPKCRHVFYLAKYEEMPYNEISKMLGISVATVNYHVGYAMKHLKTRLRGINVK